MTMTSKNVCYIYIGLWMLYGLQALLKLQGVVAQLIFIVLMGMSFYAFYQVCAHCKTCPYLKWLNIMLVILSIYGVITIISGERIFKGHEMLVNYTYLQALYISVMPIYAFYYYSLRRQLKPESITIVFLVLFAFSALSFFQQFVKISVSSGKEDIVNNMGFLFVPLIPMLSLVKLKNVWKYVLAMVAFGFIILSMKRGAILTGSVMLLLFMRRNLKVRTKTQVASAFLLLLTVIFVMYRFVMNLYENNAFFHKRFDMTMGGYSSQRDKLYSFFWHYFTERTSVWEFFFGHGANGTVALYGQYAHNDWLEFAINQGLLGVFSYIIYWCVFICEWKNCKSSKECRTALGDIIIAYILISLFSMSFGSMPLTASLCIGYCLAVNMRRKQMESVNREITIKLN